jgi:hypothetical protein
VVRGCEDLGPVPGRVRGRSRYGSEFASCWPTPTMLIHSHSQETKNSIDFDCTRNM